MSNILIYMRKKNSAAMHQRILASFICFLFLLTSANGQSFSITSQKDKDSKEVTIGFGVYSSPSYEGGKKYTTRATPFLNLKFKNISINPITGVRANFIKWENWSAGVGLGGNFGRYAKQDQYLSGIGNVSGTLESIVFAKYKAQLYSINYALYTDILRNGHKGSYLKGSLDTGFPLLDIGTFVRASLSMTLADKNYLNSFFRVSPSQSLSSGLPEYYLSPGLKDIAANLLMIYKFNDRISLSSNLSYKELMGEVAKSPIVQKKSLFSGGISLNYRY